MGSMALALVLLSARSRSPVTSPNSASLRTRASGGPSELLPHNCNTVLGTNLNVGSRQRDLKSVSMPGKTLGEGGGGV